MPKTVYILIGSNLGDRERFLTQAGARLGEIEGLEVIATSAVYVSDAVEMPEGSPSFLNQVVKADYQYTPRELLRTLQLIEGELGRRGKGEMLPRTVDLDILLFGDHVETTPELTIPHPRMLDRGFVLVPLLQIDPDIVHPATGKPIADHVTDEMRSSVLVYRDQVARNS